MGVTTHSNNLVQKHKGNAVSMLELGSQNTYFDSEQMGVAKDYYTKQGFEHHSIDANGEYGSEVADLSTVLELAQVDIVTDFGTSEHVSNYYNCWLNKHNACKIGGLIISENPKVDNWHGHGFHYLTKEFYTELCKVAAYELVEVGEHAAMGNVTDGWNVYAVLRKISDKFPSRGKFNELPFTSTLAPDGTEFIPFEGSEAEAKVKAYQERFPADDEQPKKENVTLKEIVAFCKENLPQKAETANLTQLRVQVASLNKEFIALPYGSDEANFVKAKLKEVTDKLRKLESEVGTMHINKPINEPSPAPKKRGRPSKKKK